MFIRITLTYKMVFIRINLHLKLLTGLHQAMNIKVSILNMNIIISGSMHQQ